MATYDPVVLNIIEIPSFHRSFVANLLIMVVSKLFLSKLLIEMRCIQANRRENLMFSSVYVLVA